ncbi:unannotated protein [freshwater metagenome]|uniref:Unannotated protein n=1 Tax=freshwater metagenome TaxID=449393 RepID=A0A6J6WVY7_9ZZZZ
MFKDKFLMNAQRRHFFLATAGLFLSRTALAAAGQKINAIVYKDPNCGCCQDWVIHLEKNGFTVVLKDQANSKERSKLGMPSKYSSCHTAIIENYLIEGHVPAADILRLLKEKPDALGLSVPGMVVGTPGMDGPAYDDLKEPFKVLLIRKNGTAEIFNSYA